MPQLTRKENEALYKMFDDFTLNDQRNYYKVSVERYRKSAGQINTYRAIFSLATGFASALAGLIVQTYFLSSTLANGQPTCSLEPGQCTTLSFMAILLIIIAIIAPVLGGAFNTLSDLYQWDRLVTVYSAALDNIEVADAHSPDEELDDRAYRANLMVYAEGTLQVMKDESAQWGQLIRTPAQLEEFLAQETARAEQVSNDRSFMNPGGATVGTTAANRFGEPLPGAPTNPAPIGGTYPGNNPQPSAPPYVPTPMPPVVNNPVPPQSVPPQPPVSQPVPPTNQPQPQPPIVNNPVAPQPPTPPVSQPVPPTNQPQPQPPVVNNPVAPQPPTNHPQPQPPAGNNPVPPPALQPPTPPTNQPPYVPPTDNRPNQPPRPPQMPRNVAQAVPHSTANNTPAPVDNEPSNTPPPAEPLGEDPSAAG